MFESRFEILGWAAGILIVVTMGVLVFTGPFHHINHSSAAPPPSAPTVHVKILTDPSTIGRYQPADITVRVGQPVIFTNDSNAVHTVTARKELNGALPFDSRDIATGAHKWTFTPTRPGSYPYYCIYHPGMKGKITVNS